MLSLLPEASGVIASLFAFAAPKETKKISGIENAVLEPLRDEAESEAATVPPPPAGDVEFDFDGDNKADIGRWRGVATDFKTKNSGSSGYSTYTLGSSSAIAAPGDFNGDGQTDACVFSAGIWTYKTSPSATAQTISFGTAGDIPYAGDYDGDGVTDAAVFRPSTNYWWIRQSTNGAAVSYQWGAAGDIPITGNWDGDTKTDIAVYRSGTWYIQKSSGGNLYLYWGLSYDIPVQGDFDGDGKSDATVFRPTTGTWYILKSLSGFTAYSAANWGVWSDQPVPANYDSDNKTDLAVWRPTDGNWYILKSTDGNHEIHALGISGDTAVPSAYTKQVGGTASGDVINAERVKPRNATGGTNLYSQNFGWGTSLVNLSGRAGLDAGFGIGYNSLVWLKVGSAMYFDPDKSNVTPGFRMGFPVIEPIYYDNDKQKWSYMMVTPSGSRIEFRQTAASNVYETADSSYTQLVVSGATNPFDPVENLSIKVTTTDGTQMTYAWGINSYKCTQVKDRNGNYITLAYDSLARLSTMTDTLGRVITVNYDVNTGLPSTITQTWKDNNGAGSNVTHTWATFAYTTKAIDTEFATTLSIVGPPDGTVFRVLDKVTYSDGSSTKFEYNDYLQVKKVSSIAADSTSHVLNYVTTNLATPSSSQLDCPRFTSTSTWVENFNGGNTVVVTNDPPASSTFTAHGGSESTSMIKVGVTVHPDGLFTKVHYAPSGYREGLTVGTEDCVSANCTGTDRKRWTWTSWTQDDTSKSYITNPRVTESRVGDGTNTKKTTIEYRYDSGTSNYLYGLPETVTVGDLSTVLKTQKTTYNLASAYTSRRIIGLPAETYLWEGTSSGALMSKVTYAYDESNFGDTGLNQDIAPTQHDSTSYSSSFMTGRALLTSTTICDATLSSTTTCGGGITSSTKYNTAGAPVAQITPWDATNTRTVRIGYTDNFNTMGNPATYAYPTIMTDPAGTTLGDAVHSSTVKYRYDIGANVEATSPAPTGQTYGKTSKRVFDEIGRLKRNSIYVNTTEKSYVRYEFPTNGIQSQSYTPIVNVDGDGDIAEDEVYIESWFDGAGRVRGTRTEHSNSTGGWAATQTEYDILGRVYRTSVPTEVSVSGTTWTPAGDDATRGWIWNYTYQDWRGRTVRTVPSDSNGSDGKDTLITYEGCGCAGGQVTTVQGPVTTTLDVAGQTQMTKRRTQKVYEDILGRTYKTEIWDLDGGGSSPYSTVKTTFNGRDQATLIREYSGSDTSATYQDSTATFDGHGRLATSHKPEQRDNSNNLKYTTYSYNLDDSISSVTDGRGAVTNYTYNSRALVTNMGWTVPTGSGINDPTDITFSYDNLGNRTQITDGLGTQTYTYNSLSQLTSETRDFTDSLPDSPGGQGVYELEYAYHIGGQLKSYKDPWDKEIAYSNDKSGRLTAVTGTAFGGVTTYANNPQYRAWGGLKHLDYGNGFDADVTYNNRLQPSSYNLDNPNDNLEPLFDRTYDYYNDGQLKLLDENNGSNRFDRLFKYDHMSRVKEAKSSIEAHGGTETNLSALPYRQSYTYQSLGGLMERTATLWNYGDWDFSYTIINNRSSGSMYDNDGRAITGDNMNFEYDAAGAMIKTYRGEAYETLIGQTGDRREAKRSQRTWDTITNDWKPWETSYFINSSVLGEMISETTTTGKKKFTYVIGAGTTVARQAIDDQNAEHVSWQHRDASGLSSRSRGQTVSSNAAGFAPEERDGLGNNVGTHPNFVPNRPNSPSPSQTFTFDSSDWGNCELDGIMMPCSMVYRAARSGAAFEVAAVSGYRITRALNSDGTPGAVISSGAFIVNAGYGVGMLPVSWLGNMGLLSFSANSSQVAAAGGASSFANSILNPITSQSFNVAGGSAGGNGDSSYLIGAVYAGVNDSSVTIGANYDLIASNGFATLLGDCELARLVDGIAASAPDAASFMQKLVDQMFGEGARSPLKVTSEEDFDRAQANPGARISDSDFKDNFQDGTGLQVRHFVLGLWVGYLYGTVVGLAGAQQRELQVRAGGRGYPTIGIVKGSEADFALNNLSVPWGANLVPTPEQRLLDRVGTKTVTNVIPANPGYKGLAAEIRRAICK